MKEAYKPKNKNFQSDLAQYNLIGGKLRLPSSTSTQKPDPISISSTLDDNETYEITLPEYDNHGNPLVFQWSVKGGELEQLIPGKFNGIRFIPPFVDKPTDFNLVLWVGNTKGNIAEGVISITVNPTGANTTYVSVQAEDLNIRNVRTDEARIGWERGNGDKVLVTVTPCGKSISHPINGQDYGEDDDYSSAPKIGSSRIVYEGFGNHVDVTGLEADHCYDVKLYEFNGSGANTVYLTENAPQESFRTRDNLALDFDWDPAIIVEDEPVDFDWISSTGSLSTENWTFEGGTPHTDNGNANGIIFHDPGIYTVTLTGYSGINDQTITIEKEIEVLAFDDFAPDFYFASTEVFPETCEPGQEVLVDWNISNQGVDHGKVTYVNYYFSEDNVLDTDDEVIAFQEPDDYQGNILSGGNSIKGSRYLEVPTGALAGTRYILCEIESEAPLSGSAENDFTNNVFAIPVQIEIQLGDIAINSISLSQNYVKSGEDFVIEILTENVGNVSYGYGGPNIDLKWYLSYDDQLSIDDGDVNLFLNIEGGYGGGFKLEKLKDIGDTFLYGRTVSVNKNLEDGEYFILVRLDIDDVLPEENEFNNFYVIPITVDNQNQPLVQAHDLMMVGKTNNSVSLSWRRGDGDGNILMASKNIQPMSPLDDSVYIFSTNWPDSPDVLNENGHVQYDRRALYIGTDSVVTVTGLSPDESWIFSLYEYDNTGGIYDYLQRGEELLYTYIDSSSSVNYDILYDRSALGGNIRMSAFQVYSKDSLMLAIGTKGIVYRSEDYGQSFSLTKIDFNNPQLQMLEVKNNVVIAEYGAHNYNGVIMSLDFGKTWQRIQVREEIDVIRAIHSFNSNQILVSAEISLDEKRIYKSVNQGVTWGSVYTTNSTIFDIKEQPNGIIWAVGVEGTFIKSYDQGLTWTDVNHNIPINEDLIEITITSNTIAYLRTQESIYKTSDSGLNWNVVYDNYPFLTQSGDHLYFTSDSHGYISYQNSGIWSILETNDGGDTWSELINLGANSFTDMNFDSNNKLALCFNKIITTDACSLNSFYFDFDQDGFGNSDISVVDCIHPFGYVTNDLDCDDNNALVNPDMNEICDNLDNDCDLSVDESDCSICEKFNVAYDIQESFEGNYGRWLQSTSDDFDWILGQDSTATGGTGPTSAIDSSSYLFVEATGNLNSSAVLVSACYDLIDGNAVDYMLGLHMYGTGCGLFTLEISIDQGTTWTLLESYNGDQGNEWLELQGSLNAFLGYEVMFRITANTTSNDNGDIAIDHFRVVERCPELHYANEVPLDDGYYKAKTAVISAGTIDSNSNIHYKAERYVKLVPGFHARELFISNIETVH